MMQFSQLYEETVTRLTQAGIEDAETEAVQLLEFCFGLTRTGQIIHAKEPVPEPKRSRFEQLLELRLERQPLQYITGKREFWSLDFLVTPSVLIPRPETEFVLERVLEILKKGGGDGPLLDMCTGSGVIAVVLAREIKEAQVVAVDISAEALEVARSNIHRHGLADRVSLLRSDLFQGLKRDAQFAAILANPPYISREDISRLSPEVREWEPLTALDGGVDGLDIIREIGASAPDFLRPGGWLFVEIGAEQGSQVLDIFAGQLGREYVRAQVLKDWSGRSRLLQAQKRKENG